ncbi:MAG: hypothetical protein IPK13_01965 [Deltaproteobacteria bacterium]|nr:hypothetical protein [Deltaproteobacteria bacterium]
MTQAAPSMRFAHPARPLGLALIASTLLWGARTAAYASGERGPETRSTLEAQETPEAQKTLEAEKVAVAVEHEGPLVLGDFEQVSLRIDAKENPATAGRPVRASVNVGQISDVERIGDGQYRAIFTSPKTRHPQVVLVAIWRETGPDAEVEFVRIPLYGRTTLPIKTSKNARVRVVVGDTVFGPVSADAKGRATVTVVVPPGLDEVVAISEDPTGESQATVKTGVPPYNRLTLAVTPYLVRADGSSSATLIAFYDRSPPPPIRNLQVTSSGGEVLPVSQAEGRYRFSYTPTRNIRRKRVTLRARVRQDPAAQATAHLAIGVPLPEAILLYAGEAKLVPGRGGSTTLSAFVVDRLGLNVPGATITATSSDVRVTAGEASPEGEIFVRVFDPENYPRNGRAELSLRLQRDDGSTLETLATIGVEPPPWPSNVRFEIAPESMRAERGTPIVVDLHVAKTNGEAFVGDDLVIQSEDAAVTPLVQVDPDQGHYRTTIQPRSGTDAIVLLLTDSTGHLRVRHELHLRSDVPMLTIGPRLGLAFHPNVTPEVGVEVGVQARMRRIIAAGYARATYRRTRDEFPATSVFSREYRVESTLTLLPLSAGARLAVAFDEDFAFQAYVGAGVTLDLYRYEAQHTLTDIRTDTERLGGRALGLEALAGIELYRAYLEIEAQRVQISNEAVSVPAWCIAGVIGYRFGVL